MPVNRVKSIDILRVVSILGVVLIHTTTRVLEVSGYDLYKYLFTLFLNQFARFAVPLFFVISGFVLEISSGPKLNFWVYLKKRFSKIAVPYIFWSFIYYYFIYTNNRDNLLHLILTGDASYQLYFIPTLCIFYLLFPLLHNLYRKMSPMVLIVTLLILGGLEIVFMNHDYFVRQYVLPDPIRISILAYYFFILGIAAAGAKDKILELVDKTKYFLLIFLPFLIYYIFNEGRSRYFSTYDIKAFYSQWRPDVLLYTIIFGGLLFYIFNKKNFQFKIFDKLSKLSFLVFFIHVLVLEEVWKYFGKNFYSLPAFDLILFFLVVSISFVASYLIHKIPNLSKITG